MLRSICIACGADLTGVDESTTVDCKVGPLAGCGVRFCSLKCLVASSQRGHAGVCTEVQRLLQMFKAKRCRPDGETQNAAGELGISMTERSAGDRAQVDLLAAALGVTEKFIAFVLQASSSNLRELGAHRLVHESAQAALKLVKKGTAGEAICLLEIGNAKRAEGKVAEAMEKYEAALQIYLKVPGEQRCVAGCYSNMGNVLLMQGTYVKAMEEYGKALQIFLTVHDGDEHVDVAACYNSMGDVLQAQGNHAKAVEKYAAALRIFKKLRVDKSADAAMCYNNMCNLLLEQGTHDQAMAMCEAALQVFKEVRGEEHADVAGCYNNMGNILKAQGNPDKAMEKYEAALHIFKKVCGADSAAYSSALLHAADLACATGSSIADRLFFAELNRIVAVDAQLLDSVEPSELAFGLRNHVHLLRLVARFGQRMGDSTALEQWRANVQRLIDKAHPVVRALGLQELAKIYDNGRSASATACESGRLLAALRASASPCALREATGAREQLLSALFADEAAAREAQVRAVAAHSLSLLGLDGLERVDDDLVAQLVHARVLEHEVLARCGHDLSRVEARGTSTWTRNSVADVFVLLLNVLDQAFARLAKASGATPGSLYFQCKGSREALAKVPGFERLAADIRLRIEAQQPFSLFKDASREFGASEWLHLTTLIANDNKHIKLSPHVHSATLKEKSRGTIEVRDVTLNVSASGPSPDLKNWTLYHWPALAAVVRDDAERRVVSRLARKFLTGLEQGDDGSTVPVGGVAENKYLEHFRVGAYDLHFVPAAVAAMGEEALHRNLVKDLQAFDAAQGTNVLRFVGEIQSFLRMRTDWQTPSTSLAEASNEAQIDLVALMQRAVDNTRMLVVEMVDKRVALGHAPLKSGADVFASVDWLALSDEQERAAVARGVDEVRELVWGVADVCVDKLIADDDFAASARVYKCLHAISRALEDSNEVLAYAKLWEHAIDRVKARTSKTARLLEFSFAACLRDALLLRTTTPELSRLLKKTFAFLGTLMVELPFLKGVKADSDLVDQLTACEATAQELRMQSLQLRCGGGRDVLLCNEMSVALSVALGKCRAVLEHAFTRFARQHVWARAVPAPPPYEVFQAKFPAGHDAASFRANLLKQLCRADEPGKSLTELFPSVDASVWQALEEEQGYEQGAGAWVDELVSVVNESKHERVRLVDEALLQAWWARGDVTSVGAPFPLFVRDERFYPWSFARECGGNAAAASGLFDQLCESGALCARAVDGVRPQAVKDAVAAFTVPGFAPGAAFDGDSLANMICGDVGRRALSIEALSETHAWWSRADKNKFSRDECTELVRMGVFPSSTRLAGKKLDDTALDLVRAWIRGHAQLLAIELTKASLLSSPQVERALTADEIAALHLAFPSVDMDTVATRVANSVRMEIGMEQVVGASTCVGGIEFLERCVQGAARVVAAMACAKPSQASAAPLQDDDDGDSSGKKKACRRRR